MKCLCFSDSHGASYNLKAALNKHPDAEVVFFLGDGLDDLEPFLKDKARAFFAVRGNCDRTALLGDVMVKKTDNLRILGKKIIFTHGDLYGVKYGIEGVVKLGCDTNADLVLFGHTHRPLEKCISLDEGGLYLFNPGSISMGKYGLINITEQGILLSHGTV